MPRASACRWALEAAKRVHAGYRPRPRLWAWPLGMPVERRSRAGAGMWGPPRDLAGLPRRNVCGFAPGVARDVERAGLKPVGSTISQQASCAFVIVTRHAWACVIHRTPPHATASSPHAATWGHTMHLDSASTGEAASDCVSGWVSSFSKTNAREASMIFHEIALLAGPRRAHAMLDGGQGFFRARG